MVHKTQTLKAPIDLAVLTEQTHKEAITKGYKRVKGIGFGVLPAAGASENLRFEFRLRDEQNVYLDWAPVVLYVATSNYPVEQRFMPVSIKSHGQNLLIDVRMFDAAVGTQTLSCTLWLTNEDEK